MVQVRKAIEISEKLALVANTLNQEFNSLFNSAPRAISEKFHLHEQIFLNSTSTVQNSMVTLTRTSPYLLPYFICISNRCIGLTKSIISNIYMQTGISVSFSFLSFYDKAVVISYFIFYCVINPLQQYLLYLAISLSQDFINFKTKTKTNQTKTKTKIKTNQIKHYLKHNPIF
jgi:hypothetical protein